MCHFITAVLPRSAATGALDALARSHRRRFEPLANPGVQAQLEPAEDYFLTTIGHCDCGTSLARSSRADDRAPDWDADEQRLVKKGWSRARAARSVAQKRDDFLASSNRVRQADVPWPDFIRAVLDSGHTPYLGLLLHLYGGSIAQTFALAGREVVRARALDVVLPVGLREDVLYVFQK